MTSPTTPPVPPVPSGPPGPSLSLDVAVRSAASALGDSELAARAAPQALILLATGMGLFPERLEGRRSLHLGSIEGVPAPWNAATLVAGRLGSLEVWLLEDVSTDPTLRRSADAGDGERTGTDAWRIAFPVWLAAACGAQICVHTSAGASLANGTEEPPLPPGAFGIVRDHLNLSGSTPLVGLGESTLGPMFPDLTQLHHEGLRLAALQAARDQGFEAAEVVAGCTAGPALETPAERRMLARAGAEVAVQGLAPPLLAAAHAGIAMLAIVVIAESGDGPLRLRDVVARAGASEAALEDLLVALAEELARTATDLGRDDA